MDELDIRIATEKTLSLQEDSKYFLEMYFQASQKCEAFLFLRISYNSPIYGEDYLRFYKFMQWFLSTFYQFITFGIYRILGFKKFSAHCHPFDIEYFLFRLNFYLFLECMMGAGIFFYFADFLIEFFDFYFKSRFTVATPTLKLFNLGVKILKKFTTRRSDIFANLAWKSLLDKIKLALNC